MHNSQQQHPSASNHNAHSLDRSQIIIKQLVQRLIALIDDEPNEEIEMATLHRLKKVILDQISVCGQCPDYDFYLDLSWIYLRTGHYDDGLQYFNQRLPSRDDDAYFVDGPSADKESESTNQRNECIESEQRLHEIPKDIEIAIRSNLALMLCRRCDYEEALRHCLIIKDLDRLQSPDIYVLFIELVVMHRQRHWHQAVDRALLILDRALDLDRHSVFEVHCILSECHSKIGALDKADAILEKDILPHTLWKEQNERKSRNERNEWNLTPRFISIWKLYLEHLCRAKRWTKGYALCTQLFAANNTAFQFDAAMIRLNELFTLKKYESSRQFVIDAEHFGNQCRFVNHCDVKDNVNCIFTKRHHFGNTSCPSAVEVWLKSTAKIEKGSELMVDYGPGYWGNVESAVPLQQREQWNEGFIFSHLVLDEMESELKLKDLVQRHHAENALLGDKRYPPLVEVKRDRHGGFGLFSTRTIKANTFILRYAGIRKLVTHFDQSRSRYVIEILTKS